MLQRRLWSDTLVSEPTLFQHFQIWSIKTVVLSTTVNGSWRVVWQPFSSANYKLLIKNWLEKRRETLRLLYRLLQRQLTWHFHFVSGGPSWTNTTFVQKISPLRTAIRMPQASKGEISKGCSLAVELITSRSFATALISSSPIREISKSMIVRRTTLKLKRHVNRATWPHTWKINRTKVFAGVYWKHLVVFVFYAFHSRLHFPRILSK